VEEMCGERWKAERRRNTDAQSRGKRREVGNKIWKVRIGK
jgi:hypothetical protein